MASDFGLHCLPMSPVSDTRHKLIDGIPGNAEGRGVKDGVLIEVLYNGVVDDKLPVDKESLTIGLIRKLPTLTPVHQTP